MCLRNVHLIFSWWTKIKENNMNKQFLKDLKILDGDLLKKTIEARFNEVVSLNRGKSTRRIFGSTHVSVYRGFYEDEIYPTIIEFAGGIDSESDSCRYFVDNTQDIMVVLSKQLKMVETNSLEDLCNAITQTIYEYFGSEKVEGDLLDRVVLSSEKKLSAFKNSKNAWCQERAVVAHQIFKMLGIESELVVSSIWLDGKMNKYNKPKLESHAYNLIRFNGKTFLFDATLIDFSINKTVNNSLICELPFDAFDQLINVPERQFRAIDGRNRVVVYNPSNSVTSCVDVGCCEKDDLPEM